MLENKVYSRRYSHEGNSSVPPPGNETNETEGGGARRYRYMI